MRQRSLKYRNIYIKAYGKIPKDEFGRSYDIHHIDGDHTNDSLENLIAIPIQEHYNIHYANEDWHACFLIAIRMKMPVEEISKISALAAKKRVENGTHYWLSKEHSKEVSSRINEAVNNGTYHMLGGKIQKDFQLERSKKGIHQWNGSSHNFDKLKNGTHSSQKEFECPHCGTKGKGSTNAKRWHFDNCKKKGN